jgi:hypothetical protein
MTRKELLTEIKKYFKLQELVCPHAFKAFGDRSWQFLDDALLETLIVLRRDILKAGMSINDYHRGGTFTQKGLRCNICELSKGKTVKNQIYLSAHCNGAGVDFTAKGMTAEQARQKIRDEADSLPHAIRLEQDVSWVHVDTFDYGNGKKINEFKG